MTRRITIHKPTHKWFNGAHPIAICIGQLRGSTLYMNRLDYCGNVVEKGWAVESAAMHLTGYGKGVSLLDPQGIQLMQGAWRFVFGYDVPAPTKCERHETQQDPAQ